MRRFNIRWLTMVIVVTGAIISPVTAEQIPYFPPPPSHKTVGCSYERSGRTAPGLDDFEQKWYAGQLSAAGEPSLYDRSRGSEGSESLRFTWLRSFDPAIFVRVDHIGSASPMLHAKELSGAGGYAPGSMKRQVDRPLTPREASTLSAALRQARPFSGPAKTCETGCDGAEWLIEGAERGNYRFVVRWSPQSGAVRQVGLALLVLTGWRIKEVY